MPRKPFTTRGTLSILAMSAMMIVTLTVVPGASAKQKERVGDRVSVLADRYQTFPAGQPFHIAHGLAVAPDWSDYDAIGKWGFSLTIDGAEREADYVERSPFLSPEGFLLSRIFVHNFPEGMTGTHTFTGRWFGPCQSLVDAGSGPSVCDKPTETVDWFQRTITVAFVPTPQTPNLALGKQVTASSSFATNPPDLAVDGSYWSYWSSGGFPPAWIEVDLGGQHTIGLIVLSITQLPDSNTVHRVYGKAQVGDSYELLHEFAGFTRDLDTLSFAPTITQPMRFIRIDTVSSASWVGWREIGVYGAS